jgi:ribosomal protein L37E
MNDCGSFGREEKIREKEWRRQKRRRERQE